MAYLSCILVALLIKLNKSAIPILILFSLSELLFLAIESEYTYALISSISFGLTAIYFTEKNIRISIALSCIMLVFAYLAIDSHYNPNIETKFYESFSYIIASIDCYIIYLLVKKDAIFLLRSMRNSIRSVFNEWTPARISSGISGMYHYLLSIFKSKKTKTESRWKEC